MTRKVGDLLIGICLLWAVHAIGVEKMPPLGRPVGLLSSAAYTNVEEAVDFEVLYELELPDDGVFRNSTSVPYAVDRRAHITGVVTRVAYYLELDGEWVYVSMEPFTDDMHKFGLPHNVDNPVKFQQFVTNLNVYAGGGAETNVTTGTGIATGNIEFCPSNYSTVDDIGIPGADDSVYDFGDGGMGIGVGYGSFQIHNYLAGETVFAYNRWGASGADDVGIGNNPAPGGNPDWTFTGNADGYTVKTLVVLVNQFTDVPPHAPEGLVVVTSAVGRVELAWDSVPKTISYIVIRDGEVAGETSDTHFTDWNVEPGSDYAYQVAAANMFGRSPYSASVPAHTGAGFTPPNVFTNVPESGEFEIIFGIDLLNDASYRDGREPDYLVNRSESGILQFKRVAYYMELDSEWVYVSMDPFTNNIKAVGIPSSALGYSFQQDVNNMNVFAGGGAEARVVTGENIITGNIEFWPNNYAAGDDGIYNHSDVLTNVNPGYGCMQIHNHVEESPHTILAYNCWGGSGIDDVGIGNRKSLNTDWTFAHNASSFAVKRLFVLAMANHDVDRDGLPDGWELRNLLGLQFNGNDDPDGDGMINSDELVAGTRPADAESCVTISITREGGESLLNFGTVVRRSYRVQYRTSLLDGIWESLGSIVHGTGESASVTDSVINAKCFYRLQVTEE